MKKLHELRKNKLMIFSFALMAVILLISFLTGGLSGGVGVGLAMIMPVAFSAEETDFVEKVKSEVSKVIEKQNKDYISETKASELINEIVTKNLESGKVEIEKMKSILDGFGVTIDSFKKGTKSKENFFDALKIAFDENKDAIKSTLTGGRVKLNIKTAATTIATGNFGSGVVLGFRESGVAGTLPNEFDALSLVWLMNGGKDSNPLSWIELAKLNGGSDLVTEGSDKPLMDVSWVKGEATAKTIAVISAISKQAVNNYSLLESEVRSELLINLRNKINSQIVNGTGTAEINGILGLYATAFNAAGVTIVNPNMWDVLSLAWKQSRKKYKGCKPNAILVSIGTAVEMDLTKNTDGIYQMPFWMLAGNRELKGCKIIESDDIADGEYLIGNFNDYLFNTVEPITIEIGWIDDMFLKNQYAIRAEMEGMGRVKSNRNSFVKGVFATDILEITPSLS